MVMCSHTQTHTHHKSLLEWDAVWSAREGEVTGGVGWGEWVQMWEQNVFSFDAIECILMACIKSFCSVMSYWCG